VGQEQDEDRDQVQNRFVPRSSVCGKKRSHDDA
jgi:hypothetical protein